MKKIAVIATHNKDKLIEIKSILKESKQLASVEFLSLRDFPNIPEIIEDGKTMQENAVKKALTTAKITNLITIADDTGLEVKFLNGAPGVYSARFAGPGCTYNDNNMKLLNLMKDVPTDKRDARFTCIVAIAKPNGDYFIVEGSIKGMIATEPKGKNGFGYDPLFYVPEHNKSFAELDTKTKNKISHRAKAINKSKKVLIELLAKF
jgi:XTP/dITP diphosphohydrolase